MARYVDLDDVERWVRRTTDSSKPTGKSLQLVVDGVERAWDSKCNDRFAATEITDMLIDNDYSSFVSIPHCQSISRITVDGRVLASSKYKLCPRAGLLEDGEGFVKLQRLDGNWGSGEIRISGMFGWDPTPADVITALLYQIEMEYVVREGMQPLAAFGDNIVIDDGKPYHKITYNTMQRYINTASHIGAV